jgi:hypothetical protein
LPKFSTLLGCFQPKKQPRHKKKKEKKIKFKRKKVEPKLKFEAELGIN